MKFTVRLTSIILIFSLCFAANGFAGDLDNSRLIPSDSVAVFQNGKKIADYTEEMPVPKGALLSCKGKCAIKLDGMVIVGEDQSQFSIDSKNSKRFLSVKKGTVYFGVSADSRPLVFITPKGVVSSNQVMINASYRNLMEGYVKVADDSSEVGVTGGGSMLLATKDGQKMIKPGEAFLLAQADMHASGEGVDKKKGGWWNSLTNGQKVAIGAAGAAGAGILAAVIANNTNNGSSGSPSNP